MATRVAWSAALFLSRKDDETEREGEREGGRERERERGGREREGAVTALIPLDSRSPHAETIYTEGGESTLVDWGWRIGLQVSSCLLSL